MSRKQPGFVARRRAISSTPDTALMLPVALRRTQSHTAMHGLPQLFGTPLPRSKGSDAVPFFRKRAELAMAHHRPHDALQQYLIILSTVQVAHGFGTQYISALIDVAAAFKNVGQLNDALSTINKALTLVGEMLSKLETEEVDDCLGDLYSMALHESSRIHSARGKMVNATVELEVAIVNQRQHLAWIEEWKGRDSPKVAVPLQELGHLLMREGSREKLGEAAKIWERLEKVTDDEAVRENATFLRKNCEHLLLLRIENDSARVIQSAYQGYRVRRESTSCSSHKGSDGEAAVWRMNRPVRP